MTASDPDGDELRYRWSLPSGPATGPGPHTVTVDEPGEWFVSVEVSDAPRRGAAARYEHRSTLLVVEGWEPTVIAARESTIAAEVIARHNAERAARGITPLTYDADLASSARSWSAARATAGWGPLESDPSWTVPLLGHDDAWLDVAANNGRGENLFAMSDWSADTAPLLGLPAGHGTAVAAHVNWMHSDGHRRALLNPRFERVGVGVICDASTGQVWVTTRFAGPPAITWEDVPPGPGDGEPVVAAPPTSPGDGVTCTRG